jgi:tetratricopeptide (TPR) repeat protein
MIKNFGLDNIIRKYNAPTKKVKKIPKTLEANDFSKEMANAQYIVGVGLVKKNDYAEAIKFLRSAIKYNPNAAAYYYYLGIALCKNGNKTQALTQIKNAIELSPDNLKYQHTKKIVEDAAN